MGFQRPLFGNKALPHRLISKVRSQNLSAVNSASGQLKSRYTLENATVCEFRLLQADSFLYCAVVCTQSRSGFTNGTSFTQSFPPRAECLLATSVFIRPSPGESDMSPRSGLGRHHWAPFVRGLRLHTHKSLPQRPIGQASHTQLLRHTFRRIAHYAELWIAV